MANKPNLTPDDLRQLLRYEPETGLLFWRAREQAIVDKIRGSERTHPISYWNGRYAGKRALCLNIKSGYVTGTVFGQGIYGHRAAWMITYGETPTLKIDHINGDRSDNKISNLRLAGDDQNARNRLGWKRKTTSSYCGVSFDPERQKWAAEIRCGDADNPRRRVKLGRFDSEVDAALAYDAKARELHGEFARTNF